MKRKHLIVIVTFSFALVVGYSVFAYFAYDENSNKAKFFKDFIPLVAMLVAAFLTAAFQRRISFLQALRDLWKQMIPALQMLLTEAEKPVSTQVNYLAGLAAWCGTIDAVRGVFRNVGGRYPFEPLHTILKLYQQLDPRLPVPARPAARLAIKGQITTEWKRVHNALLAEFDASKPTMPLLN